MAERVQIHDDIKLYTTFDKFYLEPTIQPKEIMIIDRVTGEAYVKEKSAVTIPIPPSAYKPICGFLGSIKLISGLYLVVVKYRVLVGKINEQDVYQLAGAEIIPYARSLTHLSRKQMDDNATYEKMIRSVLETPGLYFSYGYDLTHTLQRLHTVPADFHQMSMTSRADGRFLWNGHLLRNYTQEQFARFALPLIHGFVSINHLMVNGHQLTWSLISRRSVERAGTRLFMRGVDSQGQVANFVETEQIVERSGEKSSFVQTRGSIPLYWSQYPDLRYKPAFTMSPEDHVVAYTKHMRAQIQRYGSQVLVNLIDHRGKEENLERGFRAAVAAAALPGVRYEPFDFHAECRAMKYERLSILIDRITHEQIEFGYFLSRGGSVLLRQSGVFRTNCVDCLDRTNVVQSLIARRQLTTVLRLLGVFNTDDIPDHPHFEELFKNVWADHADMISIQYSGTGALKTDFTRTGKRTRLGLLKDGINSLTRYYLNNFCDGFRQDAADLFLGKYAVTDGEGNTAACPLRRDRGWKYITRLRASPPNRKVQSSVLTLSKSIIEFIDWSRVEPVFPCPGKHVKPSVANVVTALVTTIVSSARPSTGPRGGLKSELIDLQQIDCRRFPSILAVAVSMFCASVVLPQKYTSETLLYMMFWGAAIGTTLTFMFRHGTEFVDWPRLDSGVASARVPSAPSDL
ncbi:Phosphatidylinositide phosphatase SAC1-B [Eumeta japonica]|uniref:Phosphatidylinositol-3-phosphatase SAC1 n=1 Tax=Eumeta variegata TaxID=151549 RepID=A0A4C1YGD8_EUMVA|nr:Phosphatidylinositide phosphatase SAC1-B [Eumeta japonica]